MSKYIPRVDWVDITPEMKKEILTPVPGYEVYRPLGKSINYTAETVRKVFMDKPDRVNKIIWDAILEWHSAKSGQKKKPEVKPVPEKKTKNQPVSAFRNELFKKKNKIA